MWNESELIKRLHDEMPDKVAATLLWEARKGRFAEAPEAYLILLHAEVYLCTPKRCERGGKKT